MGQLFSIRVWRLAVAGRPPVRHPRRALRRPRRTGHARHRQHRVPPAPPRCRSSAGADAWTL